MPVLGSVAMIRSATHLFLCTVRVSAHQSLPSARAVAPPSLGTDEQALRGCRQCVLERPLFSLKADFGGLKSLPVNTFATFHLCFPADWATAEGM